MTAADILREEAELRCIGLRELLSTSNAMRLANARIEIAQRIARERGLSIGQIALVLNRSPSTVCYYLNIERSRPRKRADYLRRKERDAQARP